MSKLASSFNEAKWWLLVGAIWGFLTFLLILTPSFRESMRLLLGVKTMTLIQFIFFPGIWGIFFGEVFLHSTGYVGIVVAKFMGILVSSGIGALEGFILYLVVSLFRSLV